MKILNQTLLPAALLLHATQSAVADDPRDFDVLKAMSVSDFRAAGLDKLSDAQIKALDAWFQDYQRQHPCATRPEAGAAPAMVASPAAPASAPEPAETYPMVAHLAGKFSGWHGATDFTLDNGQVWEQVDDTSYNTGAILNPKVTISRGLMNSYYLSVEGVRETVLVKRIKH